MTTVITCNSSLTEVTPAKFECGDFRGPSPKHELRLEGGVFQGVLSTDRKIVDGLVIQLSAQLNRTGNGPQKIQRSLYVVRDGKGVCK